MLQIQGPQLHPPPSADTTAEATNTFDKSPNQFDTPDNGRSDDYGIQRFSSPSYPEPSVPNVGGLSPQATGAAYDHGMNLNFWNSDMGDVDMADIGSHNSGGLQDQAADSQAEEMEVANLMREEGVQLKDPFEDVDMVGFGFEGSDKDGGCSGAGHLSGQQIARPACNDDDDDDAMAGDRPGQADSQRQMESDSGSPTDATDHPMDDEEYADGGRSKEAAQNKGEGAQEADAGGESGTDEECPNITTAALRKRSTASSMKIGAKVRKNPIKAIPARRPRATQKTARSRPKVVIEDEAEPADGNTGDEAGAGDSTTHTTIVEKLGEDIYIETHLRTLDPTERPKIQCDTIIDAYGVSTTPVQFNISVHVSV